jgi:hypothetical protein
MTDYMQTGDGGHGVGGIRREQAANQGGLLAGYRARPATGLSQRGSGRTGGLVCERPDGGS